MTVAGVKAGVSGDAIDIDGAIAGADVGADLAGHPEFDADGAVHAPETEGAVRDAHREIDVIALLGLANLDFRGRNSPAGGGDVGDDGAVVAGADGDGSVIGIHAQIGLAGDGPGSGPIVSYGASRGEEGGYQDLCQDTHFRWISFADQYAGSGAGVPKL